MLPLIILLPIIIVPSVLLFFLALWTIKTKKYPQNSYQGHNGQSSASLRTRISNFWKRVDDSIGGDILIGYRDEKWESLGFAKSLHVAWKLLIPFLILGCSGMFLYGQLTTMWQMQIAYKTNLELSYHSPIPNHTIDIPTCTSKGQKNCIPHIDAGHVTTPLNFSLAESISKLRNEGKSPTAAFFIFLASGVWPHVKLFGLLFAWFCPLPVRPRQQLLYYLDTFGKWSLADVMVVTVMAVGMDVPLRTNLQNFQNNLRAINVPIYQIPTQIPTLTLNFSAGAGVHISNSSYVDANVKLQTLPGIFVFCGATILSLLLSATIAALLHEASIIKPFDRKDKKKYDELEILMEKTAEPKEHPMISRSILSKINPLLPYVIVIIPLFIAIYLIGIGIVKKSLLRQLGGYVGGLNRDILGEAGATDLQYSILDIVELVWQTGGGSQMHSITVFLFAVLVPLMRPAVLLILWLIPMKNETMKRVLLLTNVLGTFDAVWVYFVALFVVQIEITPISESVPLLTKNGAWGSDSIFKKIDHLKSVCSGSASIIPVPGSIHTGITNYLSKHPLLAFFLNHGPLKGSEEKVESFINETVWPQFVNNTCDVGKETLPSLFGPKLSIMQMNLSINEYVYYYLIGGCMVVFASWWITFEVSQYIYGNRYAEYPGLCCTCVKQKQYLEPLLDETDQGNDKNDVEMTNNGTYDVEYLMPVNKGGAIRPVDESEESDSTEV